MCWIVGIVAVWIVVGTFAAFWIGRAISHTDLEDSAAELRRVEKNEKQPNRCQE